MQEWRRSYESQLRLLLCLFFIFDAYWPFSQQYKFRSVPNLNCITFLMPHATSLHSVLTSSHSQLFAQSLLLRSNLPALTSFSPVITCWHSLDRFSVLDWVSFCCWVDLRKYKGSWCYWKCLLPSPAGQPERRWRRPRLAYKKTPNWKHLLTKARCRKAVCYAKDL